MNNFKSILTALAMSGASFSVAAISAQPVAVAAATTELIRLPASQGRELQVRIWRAEKPVAMIVFSAGGNGQPTDYDKMLSALAEKGFTVIAPVHADALARGDLSGSGGFNSFIGRIEDLAIARGYAKGTRADLPLVVMGHSFGSMMSALAVGASTPAGPQNDPEVKAIVTFSSPGLIPGLITANSFKSVATPVLTITGDKDVVQGFVSDWRSHRALYDNNNKAGSTLVIVQGGGHNLIADANDKTFGALVNLTTTFIQANALGNAKARVQLSKFSIGGATIERR